MHRRLATNDFLKKIGIKEDTEKGMTYLVAINLTPAIILGLKPHSFRDKQVHLFFLIARYFI